MKKFAMPVVFLFAFLFTMLFGNLLPVHVRLFFCNLSLTIKDCMIFTMPFVIFSLVSLSLYKIGAIGSMKSLFLIVSLACCSNFLNTFISYLLGNLCAKAELILSVHDVVSKTEQSYAPLFSLTPIISNDFTLLAGVVFGIFCAQIKHKKITRLLKIAEAFVGYFFKILLPLMPLFIFGTALKLDHDGMISMIVSEYFIVALIFLLSCCGYILLQLFFVAGCSFKKEAEYLKNLLPAVIAGFGTMSSIAALPLSVSAAEKNSSDKNNARVIVPCTVNIHLVGDCFFIPFMALAILFRFGREIPDILTYLTFSLYFVAAKFAVAAVPAGGIIVMLPILQNYLGFDSEMLGLIMAIYVLFDPFVTGCNVAGNCSLAIIFDKVVNRLKRKVDGSNNELDPGKSHVNCVVRAD